MAATTVDCGMQVRLPGTRRRVGPGVAATETFRQKEVSRFDAAYLIKAREHSAGRNRAAWRVLAILSFLGNRGALPAHAAVNWDRAHVQAISGDPSSDAAHNLPCQILINNQLPWNFVSGQDINAALIVGELRGCFGGVYVAPKVFNIADSIAEANCLRGALVQACAEVLEQTAPVQGGGVLKRGVGPNFGEIQLTRANVANPGAGIDHTAVRSAYQTWLGRSTAAFERAVRDVESYGATASGEDVSEAVVYILERYTRSALEAPTAVTDGMLWELEQTLWRARPTT